MTFFSLVVYRKFDSLEGIQQYLCNTPLLSFSTYHLQLSCLKTLLGLRYQRQCMVAVSLPYQTTSHSTPAITAVLFTKSTSKSLHSKNTSNSAIKCCLLSALNTVAPFLLISFINTTPISLI